MISLPWGVLDKDVGIPMRDGASLRANVFRPEVSGKFPVIMTLGPYGKDVHLSQFMPEAWEALKRRHPEILKASSCRYLVFETPDPEMWAPEGYAVVKVDSRGGRNSPVRGIRAGCKVSTTYPTRVNGVACSQNKPGACSTCSAKRWPGSPAIRSRITVQGG